MDLFSFRDYRAYLSSHLAASESGRSLTIRGWTRRLGLRSPATLAMILNGQRHPGPAVVQRLTRYFRFDSRESRYFEALVSFGKAADDEARGRALERLRQLNPKGDAAVIDHDRFRLIASWYVFALREVVRLPDFRESTAWIVRKLRGRIARRDARDALDLLTRLGFLERDADGKLAPTELQVEVPGGPGNAAVRKFHEQVLRLAGEALAEIPTAEREFLAATFNIEAAEFPALRLELQRLLGELMLRFERPRGDTTLQVQWSAFPLTTDEGLS